jgi:cephalosporin hydroxylase
MVALHNLSERLTGAGRMEKLFEMREMHSTVTFMGIAMQQDPSDALAIADLLWRVKPRLLIELGSSSGGGSLFYARVMRGYDPQARVRLS